MIVPLFEHVVPQQMAALSWHRAIVCDRKARRRVLPAHARNPRQRLRGSFERAVRPEDRAGDPERHQARQDEDEREAADGRLHQFTHDLRNSCRPAPRGRSLPPPSP